MWVKNRRPSPERCGQGIDTVLDDKDCRVDFRVGSSQPCLIGCSRRGTEKVRTAAQINLVCSVESASARISGAKTSQHQCANKLRNRRCKPWQSVTYRQTCPLSARRFFNYQIIWTKLGAHDFTAHGNPMICTGIVPHPAVEFPRAYFYRGFPLLHCLIEHANKFQSKLFSPGHLILLRS